MSPAYTEEDTERARRAEHSSAGMQTTQLEAPAGAPKTEPRSRTNNLAALALVAIGTLLLIGRIFPSESDMTGGAVLLTIASCFLFFAFWRRIYGLMIPGSILAGLSIGVTFASVTGGVSVLWGLALGFIAILLIGRAFFNVYNNWPVFPAVPLFAVGVIVAISQLPAFFAGGMIWLPLLLIALGVYLGLARRRRPDRF